MKTRQMGQLLHLAAVTLAETSSELNENDQRGRKKKPFFSQCNFKANLLSVSGASSVH